MENRRLFPYLNSQEFFFIKNESLYMIRFSDAIRTKEIGFEDDEYFMDNNHIIVNEGGAK